MHTKLPKLPILAAIATLTMSTAASAVTVPTSIPISGTLTDANGKLLDGVNEIAIVWFDRDGKEIADETIEVKGSLLHHMTGKEEIARAALDGSLHEVELVINGEVMEPRIRLGAVPYALLAGRAAEAVVATNSIQLNGKPAADFITREQHSWAALMGKPNFQATPPLIVGASTHDYFLSLQSCQEGEGLVTLNNGWMCAPVTTAASLTRSSSSIEADGDMLEVKQGSISAFHIDAQGLAPSIITGNALVSYSTHDQYLLGARFTSTGQVGIGPSLVAGAQLHPSAQLHVEGLAVADSFAYTTPVTRTAILAPEHFRLRGSSYDQNIELADDGALFMSYGWSDVTVSAPLALSADARVAQISCQRLLTSGSLAGSKLRVVEINSLNTLTRTVLAEFDMGAPLPSNQLQGWTSGPLNLDLSRPAQQATTSRFVIELEWHADQPGPHAKLAHCAVEYASSSL